MIGALADVMLLILQLYTYVIIAAVIASWLVGFGIINSYNPIARGILRALYGLTEPVFAPIRRMAPAISGSSSLVNTTTARMPAGSSGSRPPRPEQSPASAPAAAAKAASPARKAKTRIVSSTDPGSPASGSPPPPPHAGSDAP